MKGWAERRFAGEGRHSIRESKRSKRDTPMRLKVTKSAKSTRLYAIRSTYDPSTGKTSSQVVEKLGSVEELMQSKGMSYDEVIAWAHEYIDGLTAEAAAEGAPVQVRFRPGKRMRKNARRLKNIGYIFATRAFEESEMADWCNELLPGAGVDARRAVALMASSRLLFGAFRPEDAGVELLGAGPLEPARVEGVFRTLGEHAEEDFPLPGRRRGGPRPGVVQPQGEAGGPDAADNPGCVAAEGTDAPDSPSAGGTCALRGVDVCDRLAAILQGEMSSRMGGRFSGDELVSAMRGMNMLELKGSGWLPAYTRTQVTDALHKTFGICTDCEILTNRQLRKIIV